MSHAEEELAALLVADAEDIGWWIESVDERKYGPVSRKTLRRYLEKGVISPNTLVRHCTHAESRPVVDQPGMTEGVTFEADAPLAADRVAEVWPRKGSRLPLAQTDLPCARHQRPAVAACVRCHALYCDRCHMKPLGYSYFFCKRCQGNNHNRRFVALLIDSVLLVYVPMVGVAVLASQIALDESAVFAAQLGGTVVFLIRDALFRGAGPGKRAMELRVVRTQDGKTPLGFGQGILRWLSQFIPIFNLLDAFAPYRDRLLRRYGDRWARTRVIDAPRRLERDRRSIMRKLERKGITLERFPGLTIEEFARLD